MEKVLALLNDYVRKEAENILSSIKAKEIELDSEIGRKAKETELAKTERQEYQKKIDDKLAGLETERTKIVDLQVKLQDEVNRYGELSGNVNTEYAKARAATNDANFANVKAASLAEENKVKLDETEKKLKEVEKSGDENKAKASELSERERKLEKVEKIVADKAKKLDDKEGELTDREVVVKKKEGQLKKAVAHSKLEEK